MWGRHSAPGFHRPIGDLEHSKIGQSVTFVFLFERPGIVA